MITVLFICEDNTRLGQLAETYANVAGNGVLRAFSAGVAPASAIDPCVPALLARHGLSSAGLEPKSLDIFLMPHAPIADRIICLGDDLAVQLATGDFPLDMSAVDVWQMRTRPSCLQDRLSGEDQFRHLCWRIDEMLRAMPVIVPAA
ncbi:MAG: hypothetical protein HWE23_10205 [Rhodobacteraceae bacterium]|nr:hypothetical protein [Paracoccaceae bacterium]